MLIVEDVMRKKVIFWNYYSWNFKYAGKKIIVWTAPTKRDPYPTNQKNKQNYKRLSVKSVFYRT